MLPDPTCLSNMRCIQRADLACTFNRLQRKTQAVTQSDAVQFAADVCASVITVAAVEEILSASEERRRVRVRERRLHR